MNLPSLLERATAHTAGYMDAATPDRYTDPTPCSDWDLRILTNHMVGGAWMFANALAGNQLPAGIPGDLIGQDAGAAYRNAVAALTKAASEPDAASRVVTLPIGNVLGEAALSLALLDTVVHGWDLATATGQDTTIPDDLAEPLLSIATASINDTMRGPGMPFAATIDVPDAAGASNRLLGCLGRNPTG